MTTTKLDSNDKKTKRRAEVEKILSKNLSGFYFNAN